jgi:hypothetical protein
MIPRSAIKGTWVGEQPSRLATVGFGAPETMRPKLAASMTIDDASINLNVSGKRSRG